MKEMAHKKYFFIIILIIMYLFIKLGYLSMGYNVFSSISTQIGLEFFYRINGATLFLPFYLLLGFLLNNILATDYYKNKYSTFQHFIVERTKYKPRIKEEIKRVLIVSLVIRLLIHLITFLIIDMNFTKISLVMTKDPTYYINAVFAYSSNSVISFIFYIIYSSIGFCVLSLFLYSLIPFIKNLYIYRISGVLLSIIGTMIPALIGNIYISYFGKLDLVGNIITNLFFSGGLISPGVDAFTGVTSGIEMHAMFFLTCLGYLSITYILIKYRYKKERANG